LQIVFLLKAEFCRCYQQSKSIVQDFRSTAKRTPLVKRVAAACFLLLFLGINLVASSSRLHQAIHHDANNPHHECVFVRVLNGQCLEAVPPAEVQIRFVEAELPHFQVPILLLASRDYVHRPGRAPPLALS
jgi:hypothetical protein